MRKKDPETMKHLICAIILLLPWLLPVSATSQENSTGSNSVTVETAMRDYSYGYIITLQNDTIYGRIKDRFPDRGPLAYDKVVLKDKNGDKTKYYPIDIKGYCKGDEEYYLSIQDGSMKFFAKVIVDGEVKLLRIHKRTTLAYPTGGGNVGYISDSYTTYYLYKTTTGEATKVKQRDFYRVMSEYFNDCEPVSQMILNKELCYKDLEIIVEKYNKWKKEKKG